MLAPKCLSLTADDVGWHPAYSETGYLTGLDNYCVASPAKSTNDSS